MDHFDRFIEHARQTVTNEPPFTRLSQLKNHAEVYEKRAELATLLHRFESSENAARRCGIACEIRQLLTQIERLEDFMALADNIGTA